MTPAPLAPRVSIIIPCYNHAHYLGEAITSALNQTFRDFEIIVVDDGSTDNTVQVVAGFGDAVRLVHQENRGLAAARNAGILASEGEFIGFLDADDVWLPNFLTVLTTVLADSPSLGAVYGGSQFIDSNGLRLPQTLIRTYPADKLYDILIGGEFFPPCAVLVRRQFLLETELFDESLKASEDWDMWLRIAQSHPFAGVPNILALYRTHGNNMSRDLGRMLESQLRVARKHFGAEAADSTGWPVTRQRAFSGIYFWQAIAHYQTNESDLGAEYVRRTFVTYPSIVRSLETFYALACAEQPIGHTADLECLNLARSAGRVLALLEMIFADPKIPIALRSNRRAAYGFAYFALGILAYGQGKLGQARGYLANAIQYYPSIIIHHQFLPTLIRACLGRTLITNIKHLRARLASR